MLLGIIFVTLKIAIPIFINKNAIVQIILLSISIIGYMFIGLGIGYLCKIKHTKNTKIHKALIQYI